MVSQSHNAIRLAHVVIVVRDIAARTQAWATFLGIPLPNIIASTPVPVKLAFFKGGGCRHRTVRANR
jgi:hypothetical protein